MGEANTKQDYFIRRSRQGVIGSFIKKKKW